MKIQVFIRVLVNYSCQDAPHPPSKKQGSLRWPRLWGSGGCRGCLSQIFSHGVFVVGSPGGISAFSCASICVLFSPHKNKKNKNAPICARQTRCRSDFLGVLSPVGFEIERLRLKREVEPHDRRRRRSLCRTGGRLLRPNAKMEVPPQNNWCQKIFWHSGEKKGQNTGLYSEMIKNWMFHNNPWLTTEVYLCFLAPCSPGPWSSLNQGGERCQRDTEIPTLGTPDPWNSGPWELRTQDPKRPPYLPCWSEEVSAVET